MSERIPTQVGRSVVAAPCRRRRSILASAAWIVSLLCVAAHPTAQGRTDDAVHALPVYRPPPDEDASPARVVGAVSRGSADERLVISVLAPDHTGLTVQPQPSLYWHANRPISGRVNVAVQDPDAIDPLLDLTVEAELGPGLVEVSLADAGVQLEPGIEYRWAVSVGETDERIVSTGIVKRRAASDFPAVGASADEASAASALAGAGVWYDALDTVARLMVQETSAGWARASLGSLLGQVGLDAVTAAGPMRRPQRFGR